MSHVGEEVIVVMAGGKRGGGGGGGDLPWGRQSHSFAKSTARLGSLDPTPQTHQSINVSSDAESGLERKNHMGTETCICAWITHALNEWSMTQCDRRRLSGARGSVSLLQTHGNSP